MEQEKFKKTREKELKIKLKKRKCLKCGEMFWSKSAWNRICKKCKASEVFDGNDLNSCYKVHI